MRTDYLGFEAFVAIADLGSFKRAAVYLNLSQTALSHRIRKLESEVGVRLLVRTTRDIELTREAQMLLPQVRRDLQQLAEAYDGLRSRGRQTPDRLAFACLPTVAYNYLPSIMREFSLEYPALTVQLRDQPVARIYELVQEGEVEFGISVIGARQWDLDIREIYREPYVLLAHSNHPLARGTSVTLDDLRDEPMVRIRSQSINRQLVDDALGDYRDALVWRYEVQNPAMAMSLVAEGAALTVLPELIAGLAWQDLVVLRFSDVRLSRSLGAVTRRSMPISPPAKRMLEMIEQRLRQRPSGNQRDG